MSLRRNIKVPFSQLKHVIQIADIHVRLVKRHSEYKECFSTLYTDLQKENLDNTIIYIGGDVVHAKTDMSPEMVDVASDFLRNIADIAPTIIITGNHDCFTPDHELLTPTGWMSLKTIVENNISIVMAYNQSGSLQYEQVNDWIQKPYAGSMHHIVGKNVDMCVTPTHEIPYYHYATNKFYRTIAEKLPPSAALISNGNYGLDITINKWMELIGFICGDGTVVRKSPTSVSGRVQFRFKKPEKIEYCINLLANLKIPFSKSITDNGVTVICFFGDPARKVISLLNGKYKNADFIYAESINNQYSFIVGYLYADGHQYRNNPGFYTVATVRNDYKNILMTLPILFGGKSHLQSKMGHVHYKNSKPQFLLSINLNRKSYKVKFKNNSKIDYDGMIYCVTVPSGNLIVRRNSKIFIAGNCNLANSNRLDALSPLVQNINHPNLHYLRESGIYKIADTEFAVMSIIGDQADWPDVNDLKSENKIALFHGPINTAQTDLGFTITNRHMPISIFDGYDMVLCGDLHKMQILQEYTVEEMEIDESELTKYMKEGWKVVVS